MLVPELASGEVLDSFACRQKKVALEFKPTDRGCHGGPGSPKGVPMAAAKVAVSTIQ